LQPLLNASIWSNQFSARGNICRPIGILSFEDLSWKEYDELLEAVGDGCHSRITLDGGRLEIMSPSDWHDYYKSFPGSLVEVLTQELDLDCACFGLTTFRLEEKDKGTEPDDV
jgi:Uma2 family endonuclease